MAQSVIVKKEEKVTRVFQELGVNCSFDDFFTKFKETYPGDWERVQKVYRQHEMRDKKGKGHPMPEPTQYMRNMYKTYQKKLAETVGEQTT